MPTILAIMLHCLVGYVMLINWVQDTPTVNIKPKYNHIAATLVLRSEDVVAPKPAEKQEATAPKVEPKVDEFEAARAEASSAADENSPTYSKDTEEAAKPDPKPEPKPEPKPKATPKRVKEPNPQALARQREQAEAIRRQQALRDEMLRQAEEEAAYAEQQEYAAATQSYIAMMQRVIQNNWSRPLSARNGMQTVLLIQLVPSGDIVGVEVVQSSGDLAFDRSAENAVKKARRFPEVSRLPIRVFDRTFRRFRFRFRPEDLRS